MRHSEGFKPSHAASPRCSSLDPYCSTLRTKNAPQKPLMILFLILLLRRSPVLICLFT